MRNSGQGDTTMTQEDDDERDLERYERSLRRKRRLGIGIPFTVLGLVGVLGLAGLLV